MVMRSEAPFHSTTKRMEATYSGIMTPRPAPNNNPVPTAARRSICDSVTVGFQSSSRRPGRPARETSYARYVLENATARGSIPNAKDAAPNTEASTAS